MLLILSYPMFLLIDFTASQFVILFDLEEQLFITEVLPNYVVKQKFRVYSLHKIGYELFFLLGAV